MALSDAIDPSVASARGVTECARIAAAMPRDVPDRCELCGAGRELTFHHLIPRKVHRRGAFRRNYDREQLNAGTHLCRLCHRAVHRFFDEMTLAREYSTLASLRAAPEVQRHVRWARKQRRA